MAANPAANSGADDTRRVIKQPGKPLPIKDQLNHPPDSVSDEGHARNQHALGTRKGRCSHGPKKWHKTHTCSYLRPDLRDNE
ncbi:hypothetical protein N7509_013465 [Penicillium cosmopolitanum]|uniref:Uncharacterized protein n=1 Tax=Penicillium cosmopolitanum TaxID=1131564 RepID=A0A9W9SG31_9EURO|nr:uncharacterized protein N7509_013465 [Penicillium cosmopolitanum]KAJ5376579.1 hypothetical protein N7509_013465 [Penicillium cosmopolitanum]